MREVVLEAGTMTVGQTAAALQAFLRRHAGVKRVEADWLNDTVMVRFDEREIAESEVRRLVAECGYHCRDEVDRRHECGELPTPPPTGNRAGPSSPSQPMKSPAPDQDVGDR